MAEVFISYARSDEAAARRAAKALTESGLEVWWDADLPAHRSYSDVIERKLDDAEAVLVLWSKAAASSQWVRAEADFGRNAGKLVQGTVDGSIPPLPFNQIQCANLKGWRGNRSHAGWAKLENSVLALATGEEPPKPRAAQPSLVDKLLDRKWWVAAALALVFAAGVYLYAVGMPGEARKPVLAVLPFRALDANDAALVAGMWEDTRTAIGRNPQLVVLGPNTVQELAGKGEGAARKAADYLLQASVRAAGDKIRVSAGLVRTKDGEQLWSQDFDRKLDDVFALQSEIAREIEGRIRGRLAAMGGVTPEHIATSGEVYALFSDARAKIRKRDLDNIPEAARQLQQVVKMDPNFAPGWAALSQAIQWVPPSHRNWDTSNHSEEYARKAIDLAPNLASGHAALARALELKGPVARAAVERAMELDPNDYEAILWFGNMKNDAGDYRGALEAYTRAARIEPLFWPAVLNKYEILKKLGDKEGIQRMIEEQRRIGADYFAETIRFNQAYESGKLAEAANIGLAAFGRADRHGKVAIGIGLWSILVQLGFYDEAMVMGPAPSFAPYLWRNDPKGLDMLDEQGVGASAFFKLDPLTENAGRVYLLSGQGRRLADMYLSLKMSPDEYAKLADSSSPEHFLYSAPLVVVALQENGFSAEAAPLLALAEARAKAYLREGTPVSSVLLARVYALQGRKEEAISLLTAAINRRWLPNPPSLQVDLDNDVALKKLKGDTRYERLRQQILDRIAAERSKVDTKLLAQLSKA